MKPLDIDCLPEENSSGRLYVQRGNRLKKAPDWDKIEKTGE